VTQGEVSEDLRAFVRLRAGGRCEYCLLPDTVAFYMFEIDHIVARKHGDETVEANLAFACWRCNRRKGTDIASFDPQTGALTALFHPRVQRWGEHFELVGAELNGQTPEGRTTIRLLQLNSAKRIAERQRLIASGYQFTPTAASSSEESARSEDT
jgi:hypothetical protein